MLRADTQQSNLRLAALEMAGEICGGGVCDISYENRLRETAKTILDPGCIELIAAVAIEMAIEVEARVAMGVARDIPQGWQVFFPGKADYPLCRKRLTLRERLLEGHAHVGEMEAVLFGKDRGRGVVSIGQEVEAIDAI
jgi:hypothetical protein